MHLSQRNSLSDGINSCEYKSAYLVIGNCRI